MYTQRPLLQPSPPTPNSQHWAASSCRWSREMSIISQALSMNDNMTHTKLDPVSLQRHYNRFQVDPDCNQIPAHPSTPQQHFNTTLISIQVAERIMLSGHSHQAWPDIALDAQQQAWLDAASYVDNKWSIALDKATRVQRGFAACMEDNDGEYSLGKCMLRLPCAHLPLPTPIHTPIHTHVYSTQHPPTPCPLALCPTPSHNTPARHHRWRIPLHAPTAQPLGRGWVDHCAGTHHP